MKRLLPFIIGIIVLLLFALAIPFLLQPDSHRAELVDRLSRLLGRKVVIGKLDTGFFPPEFRLHDVAVMDASGSTPALQIDTLAAGTNVMGLLKFNFEPTSLTFNRWLLTIHRRADGSWDSSDWFQVLSRSSSGNKGPSKIISHQGECHWIDSFAPGSTEVQAQAIEATIDRPAQSASATGNVNGLGTPLAFHADAKGHFLANPDWSGDVRVTDSDRSWSTHLVQKQGVLTADGLATQWRADTVAALVRFIGRLPETVTPSSTPALLQNWKTQFVLNGSTVSFQHEGTLAGGRTSATGTLTSQGQLRGRVTLSFNQVPLPILADLLAFSAPADGVFTGQGNFQMALSSQPWSDFQGEGDVTVESGHYRIPETTLAKLGRVHTFTYIQAKYPNVSTDGVPFTRLHLHGKATHGIITVTEGLFDTGDVRAAIAGSFDAARRGMDGYFRLKIHEPNQSLLHKIPGHYLIGASGHEQVQPIPGRILGTWNDWALRAIPSSKIPASIKDSLQKSLKAT